MPEVFYDPAALEAIDRFKRLDGYPDWVRYLNDRNSDCHLWGFLIPKVSEDPIELAGIDFHPDAPNGWEEVRVDAWYFTTEQAKTWAPLWTWDVER